MNQERHVGRGIVAGLAGELVASWVMNEFLAGPTPKLQQAVQSQDENERAAIESEAPKEDATMKTADAVVNAVTGGQHLSWDERDRQLVRTGQSAFPALRWLETRIGDKAPIDFSDSQESRSARRRKADVTHS